MVPPLPNTMQTGAKTAPDTVSTSLEVVLCCAASLAREGQYDSAERLLLGVPAEMANAQLFDLLARIYAQQGKYADAEINWTHAIQQQPTNGEYQRALRVAEQRRSHPVWFRLRWAALAALVLCGALGMTTFWTQTTQHSRDHATETPSKAIPAGATKTGPKIELPVEIRFEMPLFSSGTEFTSTGKGELRKIAKRLHSASRIEIEGQTDLQSLKPVSKYRDNEELGLARANAVALFLHREFRLPLTRMAVSSQPSADPTPRVNPSRRTVVIRCWSGGA